MTRNISNIALVGFMGVGKSSVGRILAEQLGFTFIDTDDAIEQRTGKTISNIFAEQGEPVFRDLEQRLVQEIVLRKRQVISTGGGLAANAENMAALKSTSLVVCLWASPEAIYERVKTQTHRPLLAGPEPVQKIKELLAKREAHYRQADVLMNTERRSVKEIAQHVLHQFQVAQAK